MRQVEALRDELISRLEADHSLEPRDIVVMTPDIERFAPLKTIRLAPSTSQPSPPPPPLRIALAQTRPSELAKLLNNLLEISACPHTQPNRSTSRTGTSSGQPIESILPVHPGNLIFLQLGEGGIPC